MIINRQVNGVGGEVAKMAVLGLSETVIVSAVTPSNNTITPEWIYGMWLFNNLNEYGTYTITATNGIKTISQEVLIDMAVECTIKMAYEPMLYLYGDECEDVTGGWRVGDISGGTCEKDFNCIFLINNNNWQSLVTTNTIDLSPYSKVKVLLYLGSYDGTPKFDLKITTNAGGDSGTVAHNYVDLTIGEQIIEVDVSSLNSHYYVSLQPNATTTSDTSQVVIVEKVWLEEMES